MEKLSVAYLSDEAVDRVLALPWQSDRDSEATKVRQTALDAAGARKSKLAILDALAEQRGLRVGLQRLGVWLDMKTEGFITKAFVRIFNDRASDFTAESNYRNLLVVDQIAAADLGKIGRH